jgi:hypothetical protein
MYSTIILFEKDDTRQPWENWSLLAFTVATLGAAGGILVAATLKYADAILKTLATAGSIVISTILGHMFLNGPIDLVMIIGSMAVIISIFNYTLDTSITSPPPSYTPINDVTQDLETSKLIDHHSSHGQSKKDNHNEKEIQIGFLKNRKTSSEDGDDL